MFTSTRKAHVQCTSLTHPVKMDYGIGGCLPNDDQDYFQLEEESC